MDDAIRRRLGGGTEPSDEPTEEASGINNLGAQMVGGLTGVSALHASGWVPPADLEWQDEQDNWQITPTVQEEASELMPAHWLSAPACSCSPRCLASL